MRYVIVLAALCAAASAQASIWIGASAVGPTLHVDAKGNAEIRFMSGGTRDVVIVPPRGQLYHGGSLPGVDVSKPATVPGLPFALVVRRTPDGRYWALQEMQISPGRPRDLHLARWRGAPTLLTLGVADGRLEGRATLNGKGVSGFSYTLEGKRPKIYVYLDFFGDRKSVV